MKKLPNKVTTEELLAALDSPESIDTSPVIEIFNYRNDVPLFLDKFKIEAGPNKVSKRSLYRLYLQFSESKVSSHMFGVSITEFVSFDKTNYFINLTKKELLALLTKKDQKLSRYNIASIGTRKHLELFLEENSIRAGNKWIENYVLYYVYRKWVKQNRKTSRFKSNGFTSIMKLMLPHKKTLYHNAWFKIDESILEKLTDEDRMKITMERREKYEEYKKRKKEQQKKS